jgi:hypothetical protein
MTAVALLALLALLAMLLLLALMALAATSRAKAKTRAAEALALARLHGQIERLLLWQ